MTATRQVLHDLLERHPDLEITQVEADVRDQVRLLADGRLDVGVGRAAAAPPEVASMLFRLDPVGVLLPADHPLAAGPVPVPALAGERLLLGPEDPAAEFDGFVDELCRAAGFFPRPLPRQRHQCAGSGRPGPAAAAACSACPILRHDPGRAGLAAGVAGHPVPLVRAVAGDDRSEQVAGVPPVGPPPVGRGRLAAAGRRGRRMTRRRSLHRC